ncbi:hypothetical protein HYALB_00005418 [Hymenoscyphus albidus]|uniref:Uncharacterized protein n=1 Tax=Hymenoscyphus albidus TaxID=595503 RepID=A0A9N9Q1L7_9HELO|nr:hypothetical protein HYALB_00005418 [Hymenoscyphus albidus]
MPQYNKINTLTPQRNTAFSLNSNSNSNSTFDFNFNPPLLPHTYSLHVQPSIKTTPSKLLQQDQQHRHYQDRDTQLSDQASTTTNYQPSPITTLHK